MNAGPIVPRVVDGEICTPVDFMPNPLSKEGRHFIVAHPGQTLEEVFHGKLPPWADAVATVNGALLERPAWGGHVIRETDVIQVRVIVRGGGGGGGQSNPLAVILSIAVLVAAPYLAAAIGPALGITSAVGIQAISSVISIIGLLVVNALFPPREPKDEGGDPDPQYSISGGANRARPYEPVMLLLGTHRMFPDLAAQEYTEYDDQGDQYLNQIFDFGLGENLEVTNIRLGETLLRDAPTTSATLPNGAVMPRNTPAPREPRDVRIVSTVVTPAVMGNRGVSRHTMSWKAPMSWGSGGAREFEIDDGGTLSTESASTTSRVVGGSGGSAGKVMIRAKTATGNSAWVSAAEGPAATSASGSGTPAARPASASPNFEGVSMQWGADTVTLVHGNVDTIAGGEFDNEARSIANWDITRTTAADTTAVAFDIVCQHFVSSSDGELSGRGTIFDLAYKPVGSSRWTSERITVETASGPDARNATRRSFKYSGLTASAYDVRAALRTHYPEDADLNRVTFKSSLAAIRAYQDDMADFTGRNALALRIQATGQLYGRVETLNADVSQKIPDWDGTSWVVEQVTSNPASVLRKWLQGWRIGDDARLVAGYGLDDALINDDNLQDWHGFCDLHGLECNVVLQDDRDEDAIARMIAQCGWARLDTSTGKYGVIYEDENRPVSMVVTPANIVAGSLSVTYENENLADEIIGEFIDRDSDYMTNSLRRPVPQYTVTGEFPLTIPLEGITDGEHAAKEINRTAAAQFYHQRMMSWEMTEEGFFGIGVGDVVGMSNGLVGGSKGGRLIAIAADRQTVTPAFEVLNDGIAWLWDLHGTVHALTYTVAADGRLVLSAAIPQAPADLIDDEHPTQYRLMTFQDGETYTSARVVGMEPAGDGRFRFFARDEVPEYYEARVADLSHPLIPIGPLGRATVENLAASETELNVRVFTWSVAPGNYGRAVLGVQLRYGQPGDSFSEMRGLHNGLLTEERYESTDNPGFGTWRIGARAVQEDGRGGPVTYITATFGSATRGLDGTDGNGYEDVFVATDALTIPAGDRPDDDWGFDQPGTAGALTWRDGLSGTGFSMTLPYLWRATRRVPGTPEVGADIDEAWAASYERAGRLDDPPSGDWAPPVIVGRWAVDGEQGPEGVPGADGTDGISGVAGADGEEGQGVEYVFCQTAKGVKAIAANQRPVNTWAYDTPATVNGLQWHDGAPTLTDALPVLWRSERTVPGAPAVGAAKEASWGNWTIPDIVGELGRGFEIIFARTALPSAPSAPSNTWGFDAPQSPWSDAAPNVSATFPYLWECRREVVGLPAVGAAVKAEWNSPRIAARYGDDGQMGPQGVAGADGTDGTAGATGADGEEGQGVEYVFCRTAKTVTAIPENQRPLDTWLYDQPQTRNTRPWHDGAPSLTDALPKLWRSERAVPGAPEGGDTPAADWGSWTVPVVVGELGVGLEYIFARTAQANAPTETPSNTWGFDTPGLNSDGTGAASTTWFDAAPNLTADIPFLWSAERVVVGVPPRRSAVAANWGSPHIVARFGGEGPPGPSGADGADGTAGVDGQSFELIFTRTATAAAPAAPSNTWGFDQPEAPWGDRAPGLTSSIGFLWRSSRAITGAPTAGDTVSANWRTPIVVGRYGQDGVAGADGSDGDPGPDGVGIEFIFARTATTTRPSLPDNSWTYDRPSAPWSDGAPTLTATAPYLWMSQRDVPGGTAVAAAVTDTWSAPRIVSHFGEDGEDGNGVEFIYRRSDSATAPTAPDDSWAFDQPVSPWQDDAPTLNASNRYLWMCQRAVPGTPAVGTSPPATLPGDGWSAWTTPRVLAHFGADGTFEEYLYVVLPVGQTPNNPLNSWGYGRGGATGGSTITTNTDSIFRRGTTTPTRPTGGTTTSNHLPTGWSRTQPQPTETENVYRSQRTRTYNGAVFQSATIWGAVAKVADATGGTTVTVTVSVNDATPENGDTVTWSRVVGGTATGAITQQWQRRATTTGAWSNVGTGTTYSTSRASAGTWYVRCVVTREAVSATSTAVLATWSAGGTVALGDPDTAPTVSTRGTTSLSGTFQTVAGADGYRIYASTNTAFSASDDLDDVTSGTDWSISGLTADTTYYVAYDAWQGTSYAASTALSDISPHVETSTTAAGGGLPDAVAPTLTIGAVGNVAEGATQSFSVTPAGGTYDTVTYAWTVVTAGGGNFNVDSTGTTATYTAPSVSANTAVTVRCTATARGTGTNARNGTSATSTDTEAITVTNTGVTPTVTVTVSVNDATPDVGDTVTFSRVVGGTATGAITQQWQWATASSGPWQNVGTAFGGTAATYSQTRNVAGTFYARCIVTRQGVSTTSAGVVATFSAVAPPPATGFSITWVSSTTGGGTYSFNDDSPDIPATWFSAGGPAGVTQTILWSSGDNAGRAWLNLEGVGTNNLTTAVANGMTLTVTYDGTSVTVSGFGVDATEPYFSTAETDLTDLLNGYTNGENVTFVLAYSP